MTIEFDKLYNFRDIGGLSTVDGRKMKPGILYRSGELAYLSSRDLKTLESCNFQLIIDLRTSNEKKSKPDRVPQNNELQLIHIPIHHDSQDLTHVEFFKFLFGNSKKIDFGVIIKEFYHCMATERLAEIKDVLTLVSQSSNMPALIHCKGGKDRTGLISALIQLIVGVPYKTVLEEYLLSNDLIEPQMKKIERMIRWMSLFRIPPEQIKPLLVVKADYLNDVHDYMLNQYGSVEAFLTGACGIDKKTLIDLRNMLIE